MTNDMMVIVVLMEIEANFKGCYQRIRAYLFVDLVNSDDSGNEYDIDDEIIVQRQEPKQEVMIIMIIADND